MSRASGLWKKYKRVDREEEARRERCERDTRLDMSAQEHKTEGHRPCGNPERYRALTPEEREQLIAKLASSRI